MFIPPGFFEHCEEIPVARIGDPCEKYKDEVAFYRQHGYVVFRKHLDADVCDQFSAIAMKRVGMTAPELTEKRPNTMKCTGSYIPEVQEKWTMTFKPFEIISALYGSTMIAQIFGPSSFSIRYKGQGYEPKQVAVNFMHETGILFEERVMAMVVTQVDSSLLYIPFKAKGAISNRDAGVVSLIPGFHHYRRHARVFFDEKTGDHPIQMPRGGPVALPQGFDSGLKKFNVLLRELHKHRDLCRQNPSNKIGFPTEEDAARYIYLHQYLPDEFIELKWVDIHLGKGDLLCWNHWLPRQNYECRSPLPRISFNLNYFRIPKGYNNSKLHEVVKSMLGDGDVMDISAHGVQVVDNRHEENAKVYIPESKVMKAFTDIIQCINLDFSDPVAEILSLARRAQSK